MYLRSNTESDPEPQSRRAFVAKAVTAAGVVWAAPVISTINQPAAALHSLPILVSGTNILLIPPPAQVFTMQSDTTVLGFAENCVTLASDLVVNRDGADGLFSGSPSTDLIPAGTEVCSYFFRSERVTQPDATIAATVQFTNATIVGLAYVNPQLANTQAVFGVSGTNYIAQGPLEPSDFGVVVTDAGSGDSNASLFLTTTGNNNGDSIRILVTPS